MNGRTAKLLRRVSRLRNDTPMQYRIRKRNWSRSTPKERGKFRHVVEAAMAAYLRKQG